MRSDGIQAEKALEIPAVFLNQLVSYGGASECILFVISEGSWRSLLHLHTLEGGVLLLHWSEVTGFIISLA